jgi:orotidine-5'-phosphate decarboxylase
MEPFIDRLIREVTRKRCHVVVGLDPVYDRLPASLRQQYDPTLAGAGQAILEFNCRLIDAIHDLAPAIKPQIACFERYGLEGLAAFSRTVEYARDKGLIIIEDAKRNDIGSSAAAYADGHLGRVTLGGLSQRVWDVDALTVNPYFGTDGIQPFLQAVADYGKGIFVLVKTSNPSSAELQDLETLGPAGKEKLYEVVARRVGAWGEKYLGASGYSSVGAVVGATYPTEGRRLRELLPHTYFLVPGYGAQGAKASDLKWFFNRDGLGALIAAARSINYAYQNDPRYAEADFAAAAREELLRMSEEINRELVSGF